MARGFITLFRLSTLDDPDAVWDKTLVRNTADLLQIIDRVNENMEMASQQAGLISDHPEGDMFTRGLRMGRCMKQCWEAKLLAADASALDRDRSSSREQDLPRGMALASENVTDILPVDLFNEAWMTDMLGSFDY